MKRITRAATVICSVFLLYFLPGCKKASGWLEDVQQNALSHYKINTIQFVRDDNQWVMGARFNYDAKGNPVKITMLGNADLYYPNYNLSYDDHNRLKSYKVFLDHGAGTYETLRNETFVYKDSTTILTKTSTLYLDGKGRVVKEVTNAHDSTIYKYDERGNLVIPGVSYTLKPNIRRLHPAFQLIDRNYSVNTAVDESGQVNKAGLPITLARVGRDFLGIWYTNPKGASNKPDATIEYINE
ncbi:hypothetical protein QTN47_08235 [Danxiaibacter flavus]|uniref:DUF4595 domain-containing protein n=1 Tax=Danxiaibacter flavus TaxID=3049108 RepID=A0ABV3ZC72_9BACT|nr:hypothetical protein QNM32_08235 [Chitinophagaceae bacterium DXS]